MFEWKYYSERMILENICKRFIYLNIKEIYKKGLIFLYLGLFIYLKKKIVYINFFMYELLKFKYLWIICEYVCKMVKMWKI